MDTRFRSTLVRITLALAALTLGACRVVVIVPPVGGEVHTQDEWGFDAPSLYCDSGQECSASYSSTGFLGRYIAVPHAGWKFAGWRTDWRHLCGRAAPGVVTGGLASRACQLDNSSFSGNAALEAMVADDSEVYYVSPIFVPEDAAVPITDTVVVAGKEWAQPADFTGLSWDGINALCPGGVCGPGAIINGFDMEGWTLASLDDLNALANHYLAGEYFMGPGPDQYLNAASAMRNMIYLVINTGSGPVVFADGPFRPMPVLGYVGPGVGGSISGVTSTTTQDNATRAHGALFYYGVDRFLNTSAGMRTNYPAPKDYNSLEFGAFFYRLP